MLAALGLPDCFDQRLPPLQRLQRAVRVLAVGQGLLRRIAGDGAVLQQAFEMAVEMGDAAEADSAGAVGVGADHPSVSPVVRVVAAGGDLGSIKGAAELASPGAGEFIDMVGQKVSNQWIEFDESLLKQATNDDNCSVENLKLSQKDVDDILKNYDNNQFVVIKNTTDDKINGQSVVKMELDIDKAKAKEFGKSLENVDFVKKIEKCGGEDVAGTDDKQEEFKGTTTFTVWVDKSKKELVKLELALKDDESDVKIDFTYNDDVVDIKKPDGAKPALEVLSELGPLFSGILGGDMTQGLGGSGVDSGLIERCTAAYETAGASGDFSTIPAECQ